MLIMSISGCSFFKLHQENPVVFISTELGDIKVELDLINSPITASNFLNYVNNNTFQDAKFYRAVTLANQPNNDVKIEVIQGGLFESEYDDLMPIPHETTDKTVIKHLDGTISMARLEPGTATTEFFICIGDQPELDFGGKRNPDGQGFAAFGYVIEGMDIVRKIQLRPSDKQYIVKPVKFSISNIPYK